MPEAERAGADVKNRRGNTARGRKITGMQFLPQDPSQLLITSNDSRVRLYEGKPPHSLPPPCLAYPYEARTATGMAGPYFCSAWSNADLVSKCKNRDTVLKRPVWRCSGNLQACHLLARHDICSMLGACRPDTPSPSTALLLEVCLC